MERKRAKAERLVRGAARASLAACGALTHARPPAQAQKLSERLKRSGAVAGYTNECNPFGDTNLTERCAPRSLKAPALGASASPCLR